MAKNKGGGLKRYMVLIISIAGLVILFIAVALLTIRAETQLELGSAKIAMAQTLNENTPAIIGDIYEIKVSYGEDPNSPHMQNLFQQLVIESYTIDRIINIMEDGGVYTLTDGSTVEISTTENASFLENLAIFKSEWQLLKNKIQEYVAVAGDIMVDSEELLDAAELQAKLSNQILEDAAAGMIITTRSDFTSTVETQRKILLGLMFAAIVYFAILIFVFIRRLLQADRETFEAQQETTEIMESVQEGLFLVNNDLQVGSQHSKALTEILPRVKLRGQTFEELLEDILQQEDIEKVKSYITQLFKPRIKESLVKSLNPLNRTHIYFDDNKGTIEDKYLKFDFNRVYEGKKINRVLVSVTDVTDTVKLEENLEIERQQNKRQIELLVKVLKIDPATLKSFLRRGDEVTERINTILKTSNSRGQSGLLNKIDLIFREIHGFKGEASALEFDNFVKNAENMEDKLKSLRQQDEITGDDFLTIAVILEKIIEQLTMLLEIQSRLQMHGTKDLAKDIDPTTFAELSNNSVHGQVNEYLRQYAQKAAERNYKLVDVNVEGFDQAPFSEEQMDIIKSITVQLVRNSIVHGIESPEARKAKHKSRQGHLGISLIKHNDNVYDLVVEDDGKGIDVEAIREQLKQLPNFTKDPDTMSAKEIYKAIFISGLSTAKSSTEDAGRGVGMDVIKDRITAIGGTLNLKTKFGEFTRFTVRLPLSRNS